MQVAKTVYFEDLNLQPLVLSEDINGPLNHEKWAAAARQARFTGYDKSLSAQANAEKFIFSLTDPLLSRFKAANHRVSLDIYRKVRSMILNRMLSVKPNADKGLTAGVKRFLGNPLNPGMLQDGRLSEAGKEAVSFWIKQIYRELNDRG